jgi:hypothetical protein
MAASSGVQPFGAANDLGLGADLSQQVKDETEEERKRRQAGASVLQSPAAQMLLGNGMIGGR